MYNIEEQETYTITNCLINRVLKNKEEMFEYLELGFILRDGTELMNIEEFEKIALLEDNTKYLKYNEYLISVNELQKIKYL